MPRQSKSSASVKNRIIVACAIPLIGMLVLSGYLLWQSVRDAQSMASLARLTSFAPVISNLVHELQKERGLSAGFLAAKGEGAFVQLVEDQRKSTSEFLERFNRDLVRFDADSYGAEVSQRLRASQDGLAQLNDTRAKVDKLAVTGPQSAGYYTSVIENLLHSISAMSALVDTTGLNSAVAAYNALLYAKERAGIERAMGTAAFARGEFEPAAHRRFVELIGEQRAYLNTFDETAGDELKQTLKAALANVSANVDAGRKAGAESPFVGNVGGWTGPNWFKASTERIDALKTVEDNAANDVVVMAELKQALSIRHGFVMAAIVATLMASTLWMVLGTVRGIVKPLSDVTAGLEGLAEGRLDIVIPTAKGDDEISKLSRAMTVFRQGALEQRRLAEREREELREREDRARKVEVLVAAFERDSELVIKHVMKAAGELKSTASTMSKIAGNTASQASVVAAASEEASANVQTVAAASEEMSASIDEISRQVMASNSLAENAAREAERVNRRVEGLENAARDIGDVVKLITDIASQTNLLALNATIEAARAGEAGKGFAVVANEVKSLANQTAKATGEIARHIGEVQGATTEAVAAIREIGEAIRSLNETSTAIAAAMDQQGSATKEIVRNVEQASAGTREVSENIAGVNNSSRDTGVAANNVLNASEELAAQSEAMRQSVMTFLQGIRAA